MPVKLNKNNSNVKNYLDEIDLEQAMTLLEENTAINSLTVALSEGLATDLNKQNFQFTVLENSDIFNIGRNNDVVYSLRGNLFYPIRLIYSRSSEKIRLKLSLYIPIKLNDKAEAKKMEVRVIPVKAGTIFETSIATIDKKNLYKLSDALMKEVKLMTLTHAMESDILERFSDKTIMH